MKKAERKWARREAAFISSATRSTRKAGGAKQKTIIGLCAFNSRAPLLSGLQKLAFLVEVVSGL